MIFDNRDLFGEVIKPDTSFLGQRFGVPPFSVLSARDGWWQERKRLWLSLGIKSELGRGADLASLGGGNRPPQQDCARGI